MMTTSAAVRFNPTPGKVKAIDESQNFKPILNQKSKSTHTSGFGGNQHHRNATAALLALKVANHFDTLCQRCVA
jgi:hypothetical protein